MPTVNEMIFNNFNHVAEQKFVHSSFYYPKNSGSQFLADRLSEGLSIYYNSEIHKIHRENGKWYIGNLSFDKVIFCGNVKQLPSLLNDEIDMGGFSQQIEDLESHGTTSVFCEIDKNDYSWMYMPSMEYEAHRIICTGNFSKTNNANGKMTGTIEFTDEISKDGILENLTRIPYSPKYLTHNYEKYTYPIQKENTRKMIANIKSLLEQKGFFLLGRFAEWEYYNMDVAIDAALDLYENKLTME